MSATEAEIKETVLAILRRIAPETDPNALQPTERIREKLEIDSFDFLQFVIALHHELGVDIPEAEYGKLQTIGDLLQYLQARLG